MVDLRHVRRCVLRTQQTHLALRKGNGDTICLERIPKRQIDVPPQICQALGRILDPEAQDIFDRVIAEFRDVAKRLTCLQHP